MTEIDRLGRTVAVHDLTPNAPADAPVVLLCHSAPGSGSFDPDPDATAVAGSVTDPATTRPPRTPSVAAAPRRING
jgi:hypothetical protein